MGQLIKRIEKSDLSDITEFVQRLYPDKSVSIKNIKVLDWLMSDPFNPDSYNGFIARNDKQEVAGIIGYTSNIYQYKDLKFTGTIPMSWLVSPYERGMLGIRLLLEVMKVGDFGFAVHGSVEALKSYSAVNLKYVASAFIYTKVLKIIGYARSNNPGKAIWWFKALYYFGRKKSYRKNRELILQEYSGEPDHEKDHPSDMVMIPSEQRNQWIMDCPIVETLAFTLVLNGKVMGSCFCYIDKGKNNLPRGRIVQVPYLGSQIKAYRQVIHLLENELFARDCCSVSVMAMNQHFRKALQKQGYKFFLHTSRKLFIRDPKKLLESVPVSNWHLTYYESDKGYRDV